MVVTAPLGQAIWMGLPRASRVMVVTQFGASVCLVMRPSASISNGRSLILSISKGSPVDARRTQGHRVADGPLPTGEIGHGDGVTGIRLRRSPFRAHCEEALFPVPDQADTIDSLCC